MTHGLGVQLEGAPWADILIGHLVLLATGLTLAALLKLLVNEQDHPLTCWQKTGSTSVRSGFVCVSCMDMVACPISN